MPGSPSSTRGRRLNTFSKKISQQTMRCFTRLMTAVYVLYGKPFKKSYGVGCLGEELIPVEYQELHRDLLKHRDKILAHSDASGFEWFDVGHPVLAQPA